MSTYMEECARRGQHWIRVLMQRSIEQRVSRMFGVELDFSKSGTGSSEQSQEMEQGDEQEDSRT